jgi:hypothetical protein
LNESLGTRVSINTRDHGNGGRITIDFFSPEDIKVILEKLSSSDVVERVKANPAPNIPTVEVDPNERPVDDRPFKEVVQDENEEIYSIKDFVV